MKSHNHTLIELAALAALVFELGLGLSYASTWVDPTAGISRAVPTLMLIVMMEFIVVHSSAFMGHVWFRRDELRDRIRALGVC